MRLKTLWLAAATFLIAAMFSGCGPEGGNEDTIYYRVHNQTNIDLRLEVGYVSEAPQEFFLPHDLVKTIFSHGETRGANPLVQIYDDSTDSLLLEKGLRDFDIQYTDFDPSVRDKEETFYPGEYERDYYIFLTAEDLTADASGD